MCQSHKKKRNRKYTRAQEAWELRAAERTAKLTAKYSALTSLEDGADVDPFTFCSSEASQEMM